MGVAKIDLSFVPKIVSPSNALKTQGLGNKLETRQTESQYFSNNDLYSHFLFTNSTRLAKKKKHIFLTSEKNAHTLVPILNDSRVFAHVHEIVNVYVEIYETLYSVQ